MHLYASESHTRQKKISQANVKKLLAGEETNLIKGFKKNEKAFDAKLKLEQEKLRFIFGKEKTEG